MARPRMLDSMTIAQLEGLLSTRRTRLTQLARDRKKAQTKLDAIDRQIAQLNGRAMRGGGGGGGGGGRVRNETSLVQAMATVLKDGKPMRVGDIADAVMRGGYRSNSANFRGIVNQTLIKERKQFQSAGRGLYQIKK
jgi:hypothetical protein